MKIKEIIKQLTDTKNTPGRFPTRVIIVPNWDDYLLLKNELYNICDKTFNLSDYTEGDLLPRFGNLLNDLKQHKNKMLLLLSIGEYLRICAKRESERDKAEFIKFWTPDPVQNASETTKYIIPIYGTKTLFINAIKNIDDRQKDHLWELTESPSERDISISIYAIEFYGAIETDVFNFSEWLYKWESLYSDKSRNLFSLQTKLYRYANPATSSINLIIIDEPFNYVVSLVSDGSLLKKEFGEPEFWKEMVKKVVKNKPFSETIKSVLNVQSFAPSQLMLGFDSMNNTQKVIFWIYYQIYSDDSYLGFAIRSSKTFSEIPLNIRDIIFEIKHPSETQLDERLQALSNLNIIHDTNYLHNLDKIYPIELRFNYMTMKTIQEKAYIIKIVSELLTQKVEINIIIPYLKTRYSSLAEYLLPSNSINLELNDYFSWYRANKILNLAPTLIPLALEIDNIDSRNKVLQQYKDSPIQWIDGLGVEWLPLLVYEIYKICPEIEIEYHISKAILPSVTEYNKHWEAGEKKWNKLDKLSHNGVIDNSDYFFFIASQIEVISEFAIEIKNLLAHNPNLIITSDHGSSRLAALMFHEKSNFPITPPKTTTIKANGRYCEFSGECDIVESDMIRIVKSFSHTQEKDITCAVMNTYQHYKQSGNIPYEIHGGGTPEECLVPVIYLSQGNSNLNRQILVEKQNTGIKQNDMGI